MNEKIYAALIKAQSEMSNPKKEAHNPFTKKYYADLNSVRLAVLPVLNSNGIGVIQPIVVYEGKNYVRTTLIHVSGEVIESLTEIIYGKINDAQAQGSGITYARRYGLQSLVCIGADDDDGESTKEPDQKEVAKIIATDFTEKIKKTKDLHSLGILWESMNQADKEFNFDVKEKMKNYFLAKQDKLDEKKKKELQTVS